MDPMKNDFISHNISPLHYFIVLHLFYQFLMINPWSRPTPCGIAPAGKSPAQRDSDGQAARFVEQIFT
jgi:hypothetical protein